MSGIGCVDAADSGNVMKSPGKYTVVDAVADDLCSFLPGDGSMDDVYLYISRCDLF